MAALRRKEHLLDISAQLGLDLLSQSDLDATIRAGLAKLGQGTAVDRVYYFENHRDPDSGQLLATQRFEWVAPGVQAHIDNPLLHNLPLELTVPWMVDQLDQGFSVSGRVADFPEHERRTLEAQDVKSVLVVPVVLADTLRGFLGFDSVHEEREWSVVEQNVLKIVAATLGAALQRQQTDHVEKHDALTGLPNRAHLQVRLEAAIESCRESKSRLAAMFIDIDLFKRLNDSLGHAMGDAALMEISRRLRQGMQSDELLARVGGDEFLLISQSRSDPQQAARLAHDLLERIAGPIELDGREVYVGASIGVAIFPDDARGAEGLVRNADLAMSRAKRAGRGQVCFHTAQMNEWAVASLEVDTRIRKALLKGEMRLDYQPKVCLATGRVVGAEALLRVNGEDGRTLPTDTVIAHAEANGMIVRVGTWVIDECCRQMAEWSRQGLEDFSVSVNVSARQFFSGDLVSTIAAALTEHRLMPARLEIELTETVLMDDPAEAAEILRQLKQLGVSLALDDFGSGYSSLSYLMRFAIDRLKIDRGFVGDLIGNPRAASIATAIIDLAHRLDIGVVAEGVEDLEQLAFLKGAHCDQIQGYLFSPPVPAGRFPAVLGQVLQG